MPQPKGYEPYTNLWFFTLKFYTFKSNAWWHVKYVLHFGDEESANRMHSTLVADKNNTVGPVVPARYYNRKADLLVELDTFAVIGTQFVDF